MNNVIDRLQELIDVKFEYDRINTSCNIDKINEINEVHIQNGRLLSLYFSLNYKYAIKSGGSFKPNIKILHQYMKDYFQDIDSQSKLDMTESLARIFIMEEDDAKATKYVKKYIYTLFKEFYTDIVTRQNGKLKIFSFRGFTEWAKEDIRESKLTLCNPKVFNDPFDTLFPHWLEYTLKQLSKDPNAYNLQKLKQEMCKYIKARSFVLAKDNAIENLSQLMWAHYANDHKGFCIKYEFDKEFFCANDRKNLAMVWNCIKYVPDEFQYSNSIHLSDALITKSKIWSYENELRLLMYDPSREDDYVSVPLGEHARITDIYLGERCSDENISFMKAIVTGRAICLHKMKKNDTSAFKLDSEPI